MKKHKHIFESDGGRCIKCSKTPNDILSEVKPINWNDPTVIKKFEKLIKNKEKSESRIKISLSRMFNTFVNK